MGYLRHMPGQVLLPAHLISQYPVAAGATHGFFLFQLLSLWFLMLRFAPHLSPCPHWVWSGWHSPGTCTVTLQKTSIWVGRCRAPDAYNYLCTRYVTLCFWSASPPRFTLLHLAIDSLSFIHERRARKMGTFQLPVETSIRKTRTNIFAGPVGVGQGAMVLN